MAAVQGDKTLVELSDHFDIHANQITQWKNQLLARASEAIGGAGPSAPPVDVKTLHAKIGELTLENDLLCVIPGTYMVRPPIASAMFVLTIEALQSYIRPLDCRVLSLRAPMDSAPW